MPFFHQYFNEYFDGGCEYVKNGTYTESKNYCVDNCFFEDLKNRAVYSSGESKFLFEDSTFVSVSHPSSEGGAVRTTNGEIIHNRICSFNCSSPSHGQFSFSRSSQGSFKNYVIESTITKPIQNPYGGMPIRFLYGIQYLTKTNISYFKTETRCGYQFQSGQSEPNSTFNSIVSNTATDNYCIRNVIFSTAKMFKCNIIKNSAKDHVICNYCCNKFLIEECNIIDNLGNNTFTIEIPGSYRTEVVNCYLRNKLNAQENVTIINSYNKEIKNELKHLSTAFCQTEPMICINNISFSNNFNAFSLIHFYIFLFSSKDRFVFEII